MNRQRNKHLIGNKYRKGKTPWNKGKRGVQVVSLETRKKLSIARIGNKNAKGWKRGRPNLKNRGENHPQWKGGVSRDKRSGFAYIVWRSSVFARDEWTCQTCRKKGCYLEAHHIKSWSRYKELRFDIDNGVTLCKYCHSLTDNYKGKRQYDLPTNNSDTKALEAPEEN